MLSLFLCPEILWVLYSKKIPESNSSSPAPPLPLWSQAIIIFCLHYCNNLLQFSPFFFNPNSLFEAQQPRIHLRHTLFYATFLKILHWLPISSNKPQSFCKQWSTSPNVIWSPLLLLHPLTQFLPHDFPYHSFYTILHCLLFMVVCIHFISLLNNMNC